MSRFFAACLLVLVGCPKGAPVETPVPAPAPVAPVSEVDDAGDLPGVTGRVTVVGIVTARDGGTVLQLGDGTVLWVTATGVPEGWDWLMDSRVRVLARPEQRDGAWWLAEPQTPMPADVGIAL